MCEHTKDLNADRAAQGDKRPDDLACLRFVYNS